MTSDSKPFSNHRAVLPGNSGGALVDEQGNVIGILSTKLDAAVARSFNALHSTLESRDLAGWKSASGFLAGHV